MTDEPLEFPGDSFWDLAEPRHGAIVLRQMLGDDAAAAAQSCADGAKIDKRDDDYRFWIAVLARLKSWDQPDPLQEEVPSCRPVATRQHSP